MFSTVNDVAAQLGISRATVLKWRQTYSYRLSRVAQEINKPFLFTENDVNLLRYVFVLKFLGLKRYDIWQLLDKSRPPSRLRVERLNQHPVSEVVSLLKGRIVDLETELEESEEQKHRLENSVHHLEREILEFKKEIAVKDALYELAAKNNRTASKEGSPFAGVAKR